MKEISFKNASKLATYFLFIFSFLLIIAVSFVPSRNNQTNSNTVQTKAEENNLDTLDLKGNHHTPRVLYIIQNPKSGTEDLATKYYSGYWNGKTVEEINALTGQMNIDAFKKLSKNRINYEIVRTLEIITLPKYTNNFEFNLDNYKNCIDKTSLPNGLTCEDQKKLFDHKAFLNENNICTIANDTNATEIWLLSNPFITQWENWTVGPRYAFDPNGGSYIDKKCKKTLIVSNAVYNKITPFLHIYGHRIEATLDYLFYNFPNKDRKKYLGNFLNDNRYDLPIGQVGPPFAGPGCGNAHFTLNGLAHYDYAQQTTRDFNCPDWKNFPDFKGETESINCNAWGCTDEGWNAHWLSFLPHRKKIVDVPLASGKKFNMSADWWDYILYPDNAVKFVRDTMPPTPTPNLTPIPTSSTPPPTPPP